MTLHDAAPPEGVTASHTDGERMFVDAWLARKTPQVTESNAPGEGLSWDAPGLTPPDVPGTGRG